MSNLEALPIRLSAKARQDLIAILRYTGETWGIKQLHAYSDKIDKALLTISRDPMLGTQLAAPASKLMQMRFLVGSHLIVYRIELTGIGVIRILHQRMLAPDHLPSS
jgi:toxin ParE1/3/4